MAFLRFFDVKFRKNIDKYIFQCVLATIAILIILLFLDVLNETAIIASLGATAFIVFTMPNAYSSHSRPLLGGYLVGITVGVVLHYIASSAFVSVFLPTHSFTIAVFGAIAVGIAIFVMVATDTEHPPAAGISLGLILNVWDIRTIFFIIAAVIVLASIKKILKPFLLDLI